MLVLIFFIFRITEQCCSPPKDVESWLESRFTVKIFILWLKPNLQKWQRWLQCCWPWLTRAHTHTGTCYFTFCFGLTMTCSCWKRPTNEITDWSYYVSDCIRAFQAMWLQSFLDILAHSLTITMETSNHWPIWWESEEVSESQWRLCKIHLVQLFMLQIRTHAVTYV